MMEPDKLGFSEGFWFQTGRIIADFFIVLGVGIVVLAVFATSAAYDYWYHTNRRNKK